VTAGGADLVDHSSQLLALIRPRDVQATALS
jgi:hypothetical protein